MESLDTFDPERFRTQLLHDFRETLQELWESERQDRRQSVQSVGSYADGSASFHELITQLESTHQRVVAELREEIRDGKTSLATARNSSDCVKLDDAELREESTLATIVDIEQCPSTVVNFDQIILMRSITPDPPQQNFQENCNGDQEDFGEAKDPEHISETTVDNGDVAIKVTAVGARGLRRADRLSHEPSAPFLVCDIKGTNQSGFVTKTVKATHNPEWHHDEVIPDYETGDALAFSVFDKDRHGNSDLLGYAELDSSEFLPNGFDGELELTDAKGHGNSHVRVKIAAACKGVEVPVLHFCQTKKKHRGSKKFRGTVSGARDLFGIDDTSSASGTEDNLESNVSMSMANLHRNVGRTSFILRPDSAIRMCWDLCGIAILMADLFWIPMQVFSPVDSVGIAILGWITLLYWTCDMCLAFNTGFYDGSTQVVTRRIAIAKRYLQTWFVFDFLLIAVDWMQVIQKAAGGNTVGEGAGAARAGRVARFMRVVRLLRLMRLAKLRKLIFAIQALIDSEWLAVAFPVFKNLSIIVVMNHYSACGWFWMGNNAGPEGWVARLDYDKKDYGVQYLESLGWSMAQFTPGSSRVSPESTGEHIYVLFVLGLSLVVSTCFVGSITATMGAVWASNRYRNTQTLLLKKFLSQQRISRDLGSRVTRYIECVVELRHKVVPIGKVEYLKLLSGPLNVELHTMIFEPHVVAYPFFAQYRQSSKTAMRHICSSSLQTENYAKNDSVFHRGAPAKSMYIVTRGVLAYRFYQSNSRKRTVQLDDHPWFCENALYIPWKHRGHMKGLSDCESIVLNALKFWDITSKAHTGTFNLARHEAILFAKRVRSASSFGSWYVTDIPRERMALLLSGVQQIEAQGSLREIQKAERLEIELVDFSDSDSDFDEEYVNNQTPFI